MTSASGFWSPGTKEAWSKTDGGHQGWDAAGDGLVRPGDETALGWGDLTGTLPSLRRGYWENGAKLFATKRDGRDNGISRKESQAGRQKMLFHQEDSPAVGHITRRGCAASVLGGLQDPTWRDLVCPQR